MKSVKHSYNYCMETNLQTIRVFDDNSGIIFSISLISTLNVCPCQVLCRQSEVQSTLVISKSKGLSEILRDILTSIYRICSFGENINLTSTFHKFNLTPEVRGTCILKILGKEEKLLLRSNFSSFP